MSKINKPDAALRLARTIASDILLYNRERIAKGLKDDTLFELLESEISEGRDLFENRVEESLRDQYNFLDRALVDVMINASADLPTDIW